MNLFKAIFKKKKHSYSSLSLYVNIESKDFVISEAYQNTQLGCTCFKGPLIYYSKDDFSNNCSDILKKHLDNYSFYKTKNSSELDDPGFNSQKFEREHWLISVHREKNTLTFYAMQRRQNNKSNSTAENESKFEVLESICPHELITQIIHLTDKCN